MGPRRRAKDASVILVGTHADDKRCTKDAIEAIFRSILQRTNAETTYPNLKFLFDVDCTSSSTLQGPQQDAHACKQCLDHLASLYQLNMEGVMCSITCR